MSNETKQSPVDIIIAKLNNVKPTEFCSVETIKEWCEQAKEIEKQQKILDYYQGANDESVNHGAGYISMKDAEKWYNENYGGNK